MNKVLNNLQLVLAIGQSGPNPDSMSKSLFTKHRKLNRAWDRNYIRFRQRRTVLIHGSCENKDEFVVKLKTAKGLPNPPETIRLGLYMDRDYNHLKAQPQLTRAARALEANVPDPEFMCKFLDLPWGPCLTSLFLRVSDSRVLCQIGSWPGNLRTLNLESNSAQSLTLNLPEGLESFGFETSYYYMDILFQPTTYWPKSLLVLRASFGVIRTRPDAFPRLRSAHVMRFEDLDGQPFVPKSLEAWSGMNLPKTEGLVLEAPELKWLYNTKASGLLVLKAPRLIGLGGGLFWDQDTLSGFCNLTCLDINARGKDTSSFQIPESVVSLWLTQMIHGLKLPPNLRALKWTQEVRPEPCLKMTLPPSLELVQINCKDPQLVMSLSPLPKLKFLYLHLQANWTMSCDLSIQTEPGQLPHEPVSFKLPRKTRAILDMPRYGHCTTWASLEDFSSQKSFVRPGTPECPQGAFQALRLVEQSS